MSWPENLRGYLHLGLEIQMLSLPVTPSLSLHPQQNNVHQFPALFPSSDGFLLPYFGRFVQNYLIPLLSHPTYFLQTVNLSANNVLSALAFLSDLYQ